MGSSCVSVLISHNQGKPGRTLEGDTAAGLLIFSPRVPDLSQVSAEDVSERLPVRHLPASEAGTPAAPRGLNRV